VTYLIIKCCGVIEDPLEMEGWEDNLFKWPKVHWADLRLYFREQGTFNRLYWNGNIRKAFSFYKSGFVH